MGSGERKNRMHLLLLLLAAVLMMCLPDTAEAATGKGPSWGTVMDEGDPLPDSVDEGASLPGSPEEENGFTEQDLQRDYLIKGYDIHMVVNENNTFDMTETITAHFNEPKHGIYRKLPLRNEVRRQDGTESRNHVKIKDISVDHPYETEKDGDMLNVRIGSASTTVTGDVTYVIRYNYNIGKDPLDQKDELYYNLIGTGWEAPMGGITFTIELPKEFDEKKLGFSYGPAGTVQTEAVEYTVKGRTITGRLNTVLYPGEAFTVRCELPEGYFVGAGFENRALDAVCFSLPVLFLIIAVLIWRKYGKDDIVVETVEFYPPDGINSLEAGFLYKGSADGTDVVSLLIYLADKGYLSIEETEEKKLIGKKKGFRIHKLKDYDGNDENERKFMKGLFKGSKVEVTSGDLYNEFYVTKNQILANVANKKNVARVFEKQSSWKGLVLFLMAVASFVLICVPPILTYEEPDMLWATLFPLIGFGIMFSTIFSGKGKGDSVKRKGGCSTIFFGCIFGIAFGAAPMIGLIIPLLLEDKIQLIGFLVGIGCCIGIVICFVFLPKRTPYGSRMLGRLRGFRNFLEVAEKQQLEMLVQEDPQYFYHILPYTYVLGVSDKWISKFESILTEAPDWYVGRYDPYTFGGFMDRTMETATRSMTSSPSESSGGSGGGGGGGFSGGGSGGGGGGAW